MKKLYRNVLMASAIGAFTVSCGGSDYTGATDPALIGGPNEQILVQDVAVLFGDIFKQLIGTLDVTAGTTSNFTNKDTPIGALIGEAADQTTAKNSNNSNDVASGISLVLSQACSSGGNFEMGLHFADEDKGTPGVDGDIIGSFSGKRVDASIRADFKDCVEYGRNKGTFDVNDPDARFDKSISTTIKGIMDITFVSFPNTAKNGFKLTATIGMQDFMMLGTDKDLDGKGTIRFDGKFNVSLKSEDTSDTKRIPFVANIGADYVNTNAAKFSKISVTANGSLDTNSSFNEYSYDLDFKGSTINHAAGTNKAFEYFTTTNLKLGDKDSALSKSLVPSSGELMIITPNGDSGTATVEVTDGTANVKIQYDGQTITCSFTDLISGSDKCSKPQA